jgi:Ala-tRNA(Pro) deacylase
MNIAEFLESRGVRFELIPHRDTYDAQRLAQTLHVPGREVAKTVLLRADHRFKYVVAVLPATTLLDVDRASQLLGGSRLELASEAELAEHCPDCEFGALPPFGSQYGMRTIVDEHLAQDEEIVFEGNTHHEAIRMKFQDFVELEQPLLGELTRA